MKNTKKTSAAKLEASRQSLIERAAAREIEWRAQMDAITDGNIPAGQQTPDSVAFLPQRPRLYGNRTWSPYPTAQRSSLRRVIGDELIQLLPAEEGMRGLNCGPERDEEDEHCFGDEAKLGLSEAHWLMNELRDEAVAELEELAIDQECIRNYRFFGKLEQRLQPKVRAGEWLDPKSKVVAISYDWKGKACKAMAVNPKREFAKLRKAAAKKASEAAKLVQVVAQKEEPQTQTVYHKSGLKFGKVSEAAYLAAHAPEPVAVEPKVITLVTPTVNVVVAQEEPGHGVQMQAPKTKATQPRQKFQRTRMTEADLVAQAAAENEARWAKVAKPAPVIEAALPEVAPEDIIEEVPEMPPPLPVVAAPVGRYIPAPSRLKAMPFADWQALHAQEEAERISAARTSVA